MTTDMGHQDILERFDRIRIWRRVDERAPHKPLLIIWAIGRCLRGEARMASFSLINSELTHLLRRFGPYRRSNGTHYPFWRLQNDHIWEIDRPLLVNAPGGNARRADLLRHEIQGGLLNDYYDRLKAQPALALEIVLSLLDEHFPDTLHPDILKAVGLTEQWRRCPSEHAT